MATQRINGPFTVTCRHCGTKHGPFTRITRGPWQCSRCKRTIIV